MPLTELIFFLRCVLHANSPGRSVDDDGLPCGMAGDDTTVDLGKTDKRRSLPPNGIASILSVEILEYVF